MRESEMAQFSFSKIAEGQWGFKVSANLDQATKFSGQTVTVTTRSGGVKSVTLGAILDRWNGGRAAVYAIVGREPSRYAALRPYAEPRDEPDPERDAYLTEIADDIVSAEAYAAHVAAESVR
jgi:hypothetical protein